MTAAIALGMTSAWADLAKADSSGEVCSPKIHFKLPDSWTNAYLIIGESNIVFPKPRLTDYGWTMIDLGSTKTNDDTYFYINGVSKNDCNDGMCVTRNGVNVKSTNARIEGFKCSDVGAEGEIWIQEHPDTKKEDQVYITKSKPVVKDFYVFLPDNKTWKSATPMIDEDGTPRELYLDNDHCGWYYRRYILDGKIDKALPTSVFLYRDDDITKEFAIGMGGEKALEEGSAPEPIMLADLFELFEQDPSYHDAVYFLADQVQADALGGDTYGWSATQPADAEGNCSYNLAAIIYDTDAQLHPSFSCWSTDGDGCQATSGKAAQDVDKETALKAINDCIGITTGIVDSTLDKATKKPKLTAAGKKCFIDEKYFNQLFNYTKDVNEKSCFDMPFTRASDGKWTFDTDYFTTSGLKQPVQGGFYPVEATTDAIIKDADPDQTPAPLARTKRTAEGPFFWGPELRKKDTTEKIPLINIFCNGPGWTKGNDCNGLFADGDATTSAVQTALKLGNEACVFGWSCDDKGNAPKDWHFYASESEKSGTQTSRWTSKVNGDENGGRNMHFCSESHAKFRFKKNLKFSISGNDDIWVFIDNKLAVDIGGNHLAAPGYVDLDKFMKNAEIGKVYDIDIFFCNRRTPSSNLDIKTNIFFEQGVSGITAVGKQDKTFIANGDNKFTLCYKKSGKGSCAAALSGGEEEIRCPPYLKEPITYIFSTDKTGQDPTKTKYSAEQFAADPKPYDGGIDVSDPYVPIINEYKLSEHLPPGKYYLIIKIDTDQKPIEINIKGTLAVANREAVAIDPNGNKSKQYAFRSQAMASQLKDDGTPDINQMIPLYIASMIDPCNSIDCSDPLEMQPSAGADYSLKVDNTKAQFYAMKDGKLTPFSPTANRKVGDGGIDTIYVTIPFDEMDGNAVETVHVNVNGNSRKAEIKFFVPRLVFVDSDSTYNIISEDKDSDIRLMGAAYDFYVVALNGDNTPCTDCSFKLNLGSKTSAGLTIISGGEVVNGRATITVMSTKTYEAYNDNSGNGYATLHVIGPSAALMQAKYSKMQFTEPAVPIPVFADIFDVHGEKPKAEMDIPSKYFSMEQEYLDGIGDSVVVYYHRNFHKDSLPEMIAVFWENDKDSVLFDKDEVKKGAVCGSDAKLDKGICLPRITLGGKNLSKKIKTSGTGKIKSWATYMARGVTVTTDYQSFLYDRIAPIIVSAKVTSDKNNKNSMLNITFSEPVQKTEKGAEEEDKVFSFYIANGKKPQFAESIPVLSGVSYSKMYDSVQTFIYDKNSTYPQAGDYIRFRSSKGTGLIMDQSNYKAVDSLPGAEALRPENEATFLWNYAPGYDSKDRLPSPWVKITASTAENKDKDKGKDGEEKVYAQPSFRVVMTAPFEFAIVMDETLPERARTYSVMDMNGQVVSTGMLDSKDTRVKVQTTGSYVVKVGLRYRRVNVK